MIRMLRMSEEGRDLFALLDGEDRLASCFFDEKKREIVDFEGDVSFSENLVRAVLNYFDLQGILSASSSCEKLVPTFEKLRFDKEDGVYTICPAELFARPCQGCGKE